MRLRSWQVTPHWSVKACLLGTDDLVAIRGSFVHSFLRHLGRRMMTNVYICHNHYICWYNDHSITTKQIQHVMELTLIIWQCIQWRLAFSTHTPKPRWLQLTKETLTPIYIYIYIYIVKIAILRGLRWSNMPWFALFCRIRFISMLVYYIPYTI